MLYANCKLSHVSTLSRTPTRRIPWKPPLEKSVGRVCDCELSSPQQSQATGKALFVWMKTRWSYSAFYRKGSATCQHMKCLPHWDQKSRLLCLSFMASNATDVNKARRKLFLRKAWFSGSHPHKQPWNSMWEVQSTKVDTSGAKPWTHHPHCHHH